MFGSGTPWGTSDRMHLTAPRQHEATACHQGVIPESAQQRMSGTAMWDASTTRSQATQRATPSCPVVDQFN